MGENPQNFPQNMQLSVGRKNFVCEKEISNHISFSRDKYCYLGDWVAGRGVVARGRAADGADGGGAATPELVL